MDHTELARVCEAILFAAGEPVETERISFVTETDPEEVRGVLKELMDRYAFERRGIRILRLEDAWQMCSQNDLAPWVTKALETRKPPKLSASQLEALTIIAYYQPTTKAFVEKLRGVDSAYSVSALLNKKLIEECGRLEAPGRPILYRTTPDFLRTFGLESLADLPEMEKVNFSADPAGADDHIGPSADPVGADAHIGPSPDTPPVGADDHIGPSADPVGADAHIGPSPETPPVGAELEESRMYAHIGPPPPTRTTPVGAGSPGPHADNPPVGADAHIGPSAAEGADPPGGDAG